MTRAELDLLKTRVSLAEHLRSFGLELRRRGQSLLTCCPLHEDQTPSLSVDEKKQLWHCFGCGQSGDILSWLQAVDKLSFPQAVERLQELAGEPLEPAPALALPHENPELLEQVAEVYHQAFLGSSAAQGYLAGRGLAQSEMLRAFGVGFTDGKLLAGRAAGEALQAAGVVNERGKEVLTGCVTVPLRDAAGRVTGFYGRRIRPSDNPHRYLAGPRTGVFFPQAARGTSRVYLVEGVLDAMALYQAGVRNVLALGGAQAQPEPLRALLRSEGVEEAVLVLDGDEAGRSGAQALVPWLAEVGLLAWPVRLPEGADPLSWVPTQADARETLLAWAAEQAPQSAGNGLSRVRPGAPAPTSPNGSPQPLAAPARPPETAPEESPSEENGPGPTQKTLGGLVYRAEVQGKAGAGKLLVTLRVTDGGSSFRDQVNLNSFKARSLYARRAAEALGIQAQTLATHLEILADELEQSPSQQTPSADEFAELVLPELTPAEREEALAFLQRPDLVEAILQDIEALGYVGEREGKLLGYLIGISRKLEGPMAGIVSSGSGAGKSFLVEMVVELTTPGEVVLYSRLSAQALYFMPRTFLKAKLLVLEERAGGEASDYSIRTLQTKKRLTQAVVIKDPSSGKLTTRQYEVEGPVAYLETTTQSHLNPENTSRCFEIPLDESPEQTRRVHEFQRARRELAGLFAGLDREAITKRHHNAQRLLEPVRVVIPYVRHLSFPDRWLRTRRDHERFLTLLEAVAFLHQHQRGLRTASRGGSQVSYMEATIDDYRVAYALAQRVLGVSLDELSRWARELLESLRQRARTTQERDWTRRALRETLGWPDRRVRESLEELVAMEYLRLERSPHGNLFVYRLADDPSGALPRVSGLVTPEQLAQRLAEAT